MTMTTRKNLLVKALQSAMSHAKKYDMQALLEWEIACNTNVNRGHVFSQDELKELYNRDYARHVKQGATKTCHTYSHEGNEFQYIVIKRHQTDGYLIDAEDEAWYGHNYTGTGNQLIDEIKVWNRYAEKYESDLLCPILKYFTSKSDQVSAISETMQNNVIIIAQKAVKVGCCYDMCREAEKMNIENGYMVQDYLDRYSEMEALAEAEEWRDAMRNSGNCGIIYDYSKGYYKAVFIDYGL